MKNQYQNKSYKQVWEAWDEVQKQHYIFDHHKEISISESKKLIEKDFEELPIKIKNAVKVHVDSGQYKQGGNMETNKGERAIGFWDYNFEMNRDTNLPKLPKELLKGMKIMNDYKWDEIFEKNLKSFAKKHNVSIHNYEHPNENGNFEFVAKGSEKDLLNFYKEILSLNDKELEEAIEYHKEYFGGIFEDEQNEEYKQGGTIKGRNNKTGESYGVVIGSYEEEGDNKSVNARTSYSSRIHEYKITFDKDNNLKEVIDYGYSLEGTPSKGSGSGTSVNASSKKESVDFLSDLFNPSFAKKLVEEIGTEKFKRGGGVSYRGRDIDKIKVGDKVKYANSNTEQEAKVIGIEPNKEFKGMSSVKIKWLDSGKEEEAFLEDLMLYKKGGSTYEGGGLVGIKSGDVYRDKHDSDITLKVVAVGDARDLIDFDEHGWIEEEAQEYSSNEKMPAVAFEYISGGVDKNYVVYDLSEGGLEYYLEKVSEDDITSTNSNKLEDGTEYNIIDYQKEGDKYNVKLVHNEGEDIGGELVAEFEDIDIETVEDILGVRYAELLSWNYGHDYHEGAYKSKLIFLHKEAPQGEQIEYVTTPAYNFSDKDFQEYLKEHNIVAYHSRGDEYKFKGEQQDLIAMLLMFWQYSSEEIESLNWGNKSFGRDNLSKEEKEEEEEYFRKYFHYERNSVKDVVNNVINEFENDKNIGTREFIDKIIDALEDLKISDFEKGGSLKIDKFHKDLDNLVHKTFGKGSHEKMKHGGSTDDCSSCGEKATVHGAKLNEEETGFLLYLCQKKIDDTCTTSRLKYMSKVAIKKELENKAQFNEEGVKIASSILRKMK